MDKQKMCLLLLVAILCSATLKLAVASTSVSHLIELKARWSTSNFPVKVLVDMNNWSSPEYADAIREALNGWVASIPPYINLTGDTTLRVMRYTFYMSTTNATNGYDVLVTFTPNEIFSASHAVGLTTIQWKGRTREIVAPVIVNITTYSRTVNSLFVRNVAMHELGHAFGLGHASSQYTADGGPELMFTSSSQNRIIFPSTMDMYGLSLLYKGSLTQSTQLPASTPYKMLIAGDVQSNPTLYFWEDYTRQILIMATLILALLIVSHTQSRAEDPRLCERDLKHVRNKKEKIQVMCFCLQRRRWR